MRRLILLSLLLAARAVAQNPATPLPTTATNPNGQPCQANAILNYVPSGVIYTCQNGTMAVSTAGTFVSLSGDASSTSTGGATVVNGLKGVPFCTGYTPTNGQFVEYTTGGTPNPCYTAAATGWTRTGTTISPTNPGDSVAIGTMVLPTGAPSGSVGAAALYVGQTPLRPGGNSWAFMGDSITMGYPSGVIPFPSQVQVLSNGAITALNKGISGQTCAQMLARFSTDIVAAKPNVVVILCGINDIFGSASTAAIVGNIQSMANLALAAGIIPVLGTIPPNSPNATQVAALNIQIATLAARMSVPWADFNTAVADPASLDFLAAYKADGTHPNSAGQRVMAIALLSAASSLYRAWSPYLSHQVTDPASKVVNPIFLTNSTGWTLTGGSVGVTLSLVPDTSISGQWARVTRINSGNDSFAQTSYITGIPTGHTLAFSGRVRTSGVESGGCTFYVAVDGVDAGYTQYPSIPALSSWAADVPAGNVFYATGVFDSGIINLNVGISIHGGPCVVDIAQLTLLDLTAAGLAP